MERSSIFTDAVVIAGLSGVGYVAAFFFELGYVNYFGVPPEFISLDLTNIMIGVLAVIGVAYLYGLLRDFMFSIGLGNSNQNFSGAIGITLSIVIVFGVTTWLAFGNDASFWQTFGWTSFWVALFVIGLPILRSLAAGRGFSFSAGMQLYDEKKQQKNGHASPFGLIFSKFAGRDSLGLATLLIALIVFFVANAYFLGTAFARHHGSFLSVRDGENLYAVVYLFDTHFIAAEYDEADRTVNHEFIMAGLEDANIYRGPLVQVDGVKK